LNKLNIFQVNGVWQHGTVKHDNEQDPLIPDDHVEDIAPQLSAPQQLFDDFHNSFV